MKRNEVTFNFYEQKIGDHTSSFNEKVFVRVDGSTGTVVTCDSKDTKTSTFFHIIGINLIKVLTTTFLPAGYPHSVRSEVVFCLVYFNFL
jgi:hypothetical protein